jgi:hypothetical protein
MAHLRIEDFSPTALIKNYGEKKLSHGDIGRWFENLARNKQFPNIIARIKVCMEHNWSKFESTSFIHMYRQFRHKLSVPQQALMATLVTFMNMKHKTIQSLPRNRQKLRDEKLCAQIGFGLPQVAVKLEMNPDVVLQIKEIMTQMGLTATEKTISIRNSVLRFILMLFELTSNSHYDSKLRMVVSFLLDFDPFSAGDILAGYAKALVQVMKTLLDQVSGKLVAQSHKDYDDLFSGTVKLLSSMLFVKDPVAVSSCIDQCKRLEIISRTCTSLSKIWDFIYALFNMAFEYICIATGYQFVTTASLQLIDVNIPQWVTEVQAMSNEGRDVGIPGSIDLAIRAEELKKQGDVFFKELIRLKAKPPIMNYFNLVYRDIKRLAFEAAPHHYNDKMRNSPIVIYLHGASGIGKSTMVNYLAKELMNKMNLPYHFARDMYVRNNMQEFWDGYTNQPVVWFDDYLQIRDSEVQQRELIELVRMKNTTPYPLSMADLTSKGNTRFTSQIVFITSNKDFGNELRGLVSEPVAFHRRRDVVARVLLRKNCSTSNGKLKIDLDNPHFQSKPYVFDVSNQFMNYSKFVEHCLSEWRRIISYDTELIGAVETWKGCEEKPVDIGLGEILFPQMLSFYKHRDNLVSNLDEQSQFLQVKKLYEKCVDAYKNLEVPLWLNYGSKFLAILGVVKLMHSLYRTPSPNIVVESDEVNTKKFVPKFKAVKNLPLRVKTYRKMRIEADGVDIMENKYSQFQSELAADKAIIDAFNNGDFEVSAQSSSDPNAMVLMKNKIYNNLVELEIEGRIVKALFLAGSVFVTVYHSKGVFDRCKNFTIRTRAGEYEVDVNDISYIEVPDNDSLYVKVPLYCGVFPSIINHFHEEEDLARVNLYSGVIAGFSKKPFPSLFMNSLTNLAACGEREYDAGDNQSIQLVRGFRYNSQTMAGDCGSPVCVLHKGMARKILGIHVAGTVGVGVCNSLTQSGIRIICDMFEDNVEPLIDDLEELPPLKAQTFLSKDDNVYRLGYMTKSKGVYNQPSTKIVKSPFYGMFPVHTAPAILNIRDKLDPMRKAIEKQFNSIRTFRNKDVHLASLNLAQSVLQTSAYSQLGILSEVVAINGLAGDDWIRPMNLKTSPGYPYIIAKGKKGVGKFSLLKGDKEFKPTEHFQQHIDMRRDLAKKGIIPMTVFCDILKDERRAIAKVESAKTRLFNVAPFDLNILIRQYFGAFIAHMMVNHIYGECSVGVNCHSSEWGMMFEDFKRGGDNYFSGDYSNYDKTLPFQLVMVVLDIINEFYNDGNDIIRKSLFCTMFNANHLVGVEVYRVPHGNPSGVAITVIINSLVNSLMIRLAYCSLARLRSESIASYNDNVILKVYGDDNIVAVKKDVPWFNAHSVSEFLLKYGLNYNPEGVDISGYQSLESIRYLKRAFVLRKGVVWAPLNLDIVLESMMWMHKGTCIALNMKETFQNFMIELVHHGHDAYEKYSNLVYIRARSEEIRLPILDYDHVWDQLLGQHGCDLWVSDNPLTDT